MKPFMPLHRLLLLTSMLFTPSLAFAQASPATPSDEAAQAADYGDDGEIVVLGRFIPEPMRETSEVATFLSAEDLQRQGDDTAAAALTRLSGLSVVSGRFVFVRGLGDRYSSAMLNGSPLPSPEPLRRTVPLDLFPSNILDGATVQKTFSPNYPGEFGGGVIDLRTVGAPPEPFFTMKAGIGYNTETTGEQGITYYGSRDDRFGLDTGVRDIPGPLASALNTGLHIDDSNFTDAQLEAMGESLTNSPLTVIQNEEIEPDLEFELNGGTSFDVGRYNIGLIGVAGYDSSWRTQNAQRGYALNGAGLSVPLTEGESFTTAWDVTSNALGGLSVGWDEHEIKLTGLYVRSTTKEAQITELTDAFRVGTSDPFNPSNPGTGETHKESTGWYERELISLQLAGEHSFGALDLDWRVAGAEASREAPYERSLTRAISPDGRVGYTRYNGSDGSSNSLSFSELKDEMISGGVDAAYTIALSEQRDAVISAGYAYSNTARDYASLNLYFDSATLLPLDAVGARPDYLFSPDNIDPNRFVLAESLQPDTVYDAGLLVNAAYVAADVEVIPLLRASIGVRYEDARQSVATSNRAADLGSPPARPVEIEESYLLPAATLTWNFAEDLQLRLGYSQTIARPQFRELAASQYNDPDSDRQYVGNLYLTDSELTNYDARLEYYFGNNQFATIGAFYKEIDRPIEEVLYTPDQRNFLTTFVNAPKATVYGAEIEYRTSFESPFEGAMWDDKSWIFAVNYTYTSSEIQAGDEDVFIYPLNADTPLSASTLGLDGAQLQGTPEHILNLQFGYETEAAQLTLLVGWVDERILQRGIGGAGADVVPDVIEDPGVNLDLVYRRDFEVSGRTWTLGLSGRNLLDEDHVEYQQGDVGRVEVNSYGRGQNFSASISAKF